MSELQAGNYMLTPDAAELLPFQCKEPLGDVGPTNASEDGLWGTARMHIPSAGSITDGRHRGKPGVTVQAGNQTTNTDSSGNYVLSGLCSGSYTVIPSPGCRLFNPASVPVVLDRMPAG